MASEVLFNCSILGPTVERVFSVEVLQSITVNQLKDVVKEKKKSRIGHIDSDELDIYMVSDLHVTHPLVYFSSRLMYGAIHLQLPKPLAKDEILPTLSKIPAGGTPPGTELDSMSQLVHYFPQTPVSGKLHFVVRAPSKLCYFDADF
jgi:hypothetical protein